LWSWLAALHVVAIVAIDLSRSKVKSISAFTGET
jgi:hypothetical protein